MADVVIRMSAQEAALFRAQQKIIQQQVQIEQKYRGIGGAAKQAGHQAREATNKACQNATKLLDALKGVGMAIGGGMGIAGAIAKVNEGYQVWLANMQEITQEARKATNEIISFAALQEGGEKAKLVQQASALASRYGVTDRGEAFTTIQAMQSALGGDIAKGLKLAETVFAAGQVGIPVALGRELEILGTTQGQTPGETLRQAYVAGQLSKRDPGALAKAAPGLMFWQDKAAGFAASAVLAGAVPEGELPTYVKQGGRALSKVSALQEYFTAQGLGEASQIDRLKHLEKAGIDTAEELAQLGLIEQRQAQALAALVPNVAEVERFAKAIGERARPGLFIEERAAIEKELPFTRAARELGVLESAYKDEQAFGPRALEAMKIEKERLKLGLALKRLGLQQSLWWKLQDESGRAAAWALPRALMGEALKGTTPELSAAARARLAGREPAPVSGARAALETVFPRIGAVVGATQQTVSFLQKLKKGIDAIEAELDATNPVTAPARRREADLLRSGDPITKLERQIQRTPPPPLRPMFDEEKLEHELKRDTERATADWQQAHPGETMPVAQPWRPEPEPPPTTTGLGEAARALERAARSQAASGLKLDQVADRISATRAGLGTPALDR